MKRKYPKSKIAAEENLVDQPYKQRKGKKSSKYDLKYEKKKSKGRSTAVKIRTIINLILRMIVFPFYLVYLIFKQIFVTKPYETIFAIKDKLRAIYIKSKLSYRKAKKFALEDEQERELVRDRKMLYMLGGKLTKIKMKIAAKFRFFAKIIGKVIILIKKAFCTFFSLIKKLNWFKKKTIGVLKVLISKLYSAWEDTEIIVYKIKGLPFAIIDKMKKFVDQAIEEGQLKEREPEFDFNDPENTNAHIGQSMMIPIDDNVTIEVIREDWDDGKHPENWESIPPIVIPPPQVQSAPVPDSTIVSHKQNYDYSYGFRRPVSKECAPKGPKRDYTPPRLFVYPYEQHKDHYDQVAVHPSAPLPIHKDVNYPAPLHNNCSPNPAVPLSKQSIKHHEYPYLCPTPVRPHSHRQPLYCAPDFAKHAPMDYTEAYAAQASAEVPLAHQVGASVESSVDFGNEEEKTVVSFSKLPSPLIPPRPDPAIVSKVLQKN
ncbi:hypothetical protein WICPIJ_008475 [Wickerhamomyces pijperi]|uniref:Uncharacterized protein n=1 Tax=Wickerhamomyces pijperi TaxID=599730 RepID=A0A9P8TIF7_WICPI|nr:hypothetical protein WICPIJ_008475 [Wickerhamomyces pijperi]